MPSSFKTETVNCTANQHMDQLHFNLTHQLIDDFGMQLINNYLHLDFIFYHTTMPNSFSSSNKLMPMPYPLPTTPYNIFALLNLSQTIPL